MTDDMSTPYLLTLMGDRIDGLERMINKLKTKDDGYTAWGDKGMDTLKQGLIWLKSKVQQRREEVIKADGHDPAEYSL